MSHPNPGFDPENVYPVDIPVTCECDGNSITDFIGGGWKDMLGNNLPSEYGHDRSVTDLVDGNF